LRFSHTFVSKSMLTSQNEVRLNTRQLQSPASSYILMF